jgi:hypothetical protein
LLLVLVLVLLVSVWHQLMWLSRVAEHLLVLQQ